MIVTKERKQAWLISGISISIIFTMTRMIISFLSYQNHGFVLMNLSFGGILGGGILILCACLLKPRKNTNKQLLRAYSIKQQIIIAIVVVALIITELIILAVIQQKADKGYRIDIERMAKVFIVALDTLPILFAMLLQAVIEIVIYYPAYNRVLEEIVKERMAKKEDKNEPYNLLKEMQKINSNHEK